MPIESPLETIEALTELRTDVDELRRLVDEIKQALAPSETALKARSEYLDRVLKEQLSRAEQRIAKSADEVERLSRRLSDELTKLPAIVAEVDARRYVEQRRHERRRLVTGIVAMTCGGFLAGLAATWTNRSTTAPPATAAVSVPGAAPTATKSAPPSRTRTRTSAPAASRSAAP
jgi:hypothetical protein